MARPKTITDEQILPLICTRPGFDHHELIASEPAPPPLKAVRLLTHWLEVQLLGRLRPCDPEVLARAIMGSLHGFGSSKSWA